MAKSTDKSKSNFATILDDVAATSTASKEVVEQKPKQVNILMDADLKVILDRLVFWGGKRGSQREVLQRALRLLAEQDPNAQRPTPEEEEV